MRALRSGLLAAAAFLLTACGGEEVEPRDQWFVTVATDAPVPSFGDRLLIEVLDENGQTCDGCARLVGSHGASSWPVTFGVLPPSDGRPRMVRARFFRVELTGEDGYPAGDALIERVGELPTPHGDTAVVLTLPMSCFGVPTSQDLSTTCDPETGVLGPTPVLPLASEVAAPQVGSWPPAQRRECTGPAPQGSICVPGGAMLLGSATIVTPNEFASTPERVVRISPFFLDEDEVTVGAIRQAVSSGKHALEPTIRDEGLVSDTEYCTYLGVQDESNDALPVNCVSVALAEAFCATRGMRLPTEAEWEFAASNTGAETSYPWGESDDVCDHAIVARRPLSEIDLPGTSQCLADLPPSAQPGPVAGGHERDVTLLGIRNLGGNMAEWVSDDFALYDDPCWGAASGLLEDPRCWTGTMGLHAIRGGHWSFMRSYALSARRQAERETDKRNPTVGFRCAQSM